MWTSTLFLLPHFLFQRVLMGQRREQPVCMTTLKVFTFWRELIKSTCKARCSLCQSAKEMLKYTSLYKGDFSREKILKRGPWDFRDDWEVSRAYELIPLRHLLSGFESWYFITGVILKWPRGRTSSTSSIVTGNRRPGEQISRTAHFNAWFQKEIMLFFGFNNCFLVIPLVCRCHAGFKRR